MNGSLTYVLFCNNINLPFGNQWFPALYWSSKYWHISLKYTKITGIKKCKLIIQSGATLLKFINLHYILNGSLTYVLFCSNINLPFGNQCFPALYWSSKYWHISLKYTKITGTKKCKLIIQSGATALSSVMAPIILLAVNCLLVMKLLNVIVQINKKFKIYWDVQEFY